MKRILCLALVLFLLGGQAVADGATGVTDFSLKLLSQIAESGEQNIVISPLSAYLALSLAAVGSGGETAAEFEAVMGIGTGELPAYCAELARSLEDAQGSTILAIANSGWLDKRLYTNPEYFEIISEEMGAEVFERALSADATREEINQWVSDQTRALIPSLLDDNLPEYAVLALINTLYFKGAWSDPFDPNDTYGRAFTLADGSEVTVPFLHSGERTQGYIGSDGVEGVLLPYDDGKTAYIALRATDGRSARELAKSLTPELLSGYAAAAEDTLMKLSMPKFTLSYSVTMNGALQSMGLSRAFDEQLADFTLINPCPDQGIYISTVLQKVKIGVNEKGTEAAAATAIIMEAMALPPEGAPLELNLDSPFVYAVVDLSTGIPLFIGCLDDPSLSEGD